MEENVDKDVKTILIVYDEQPIIDVLMYNLKKEGYNIIEANDGITAVNKALDEKPDLMFKTILKSKNHADLQTYIFCTLKTVSKENNEIVFPFFRHAQNINVIDNEVEK